jgi:hypothetical protein
LDYLWEEKYGLELLNNIEEKNLFLNKLRGFLLNDYDTTGLSLEVYKLIKDLKDDTD